MKCHSHMPHVLYRVYINTQFCCNRTLTTNRYTGSVDLMDPMKINETISRKTVEHICDARWSHSKFTISCRYMATLLNNERNDTMRRRCFTNQPIFGSVIELYDCVRVCVRVRWYRLIAINSIWKTLELEHMQQSKLELSIEHLKTCALKFN